VQRIRGREKCFIDRVSSGQQSNVRSVKDKEHTDELTCTWDNRRTEGISVIVLFSVDRGFMTG
jgi:hypothetical protein